MQTHPLPYYDNDAKQDFISALRKVAHGKSVLFHGTSLGSMIARTDTLLTPRCGDPTVSFTRCPEVAVHFATLPKDEDDGFPTVFVFDRQSLQSRYRLEPFQYIEKEDAIGKFEMEERVWFRDLQPVSRHLIDAVYCVVGRVKRTPYLPRYSLVADMLARAKINTDTDTN